MKKIYLIIFLFLIIISVGSIKVQANSNPIWVGNPGDEPLGIEYFNRGGKDLENIEWSKTDSLHGYFMTTMHNERENKYLIRYIEYLITITIPSTSLDMSSIRLRIIKGGIYECKSNVVTQLHTLDSQPTTYMGIKDIDLGFNVSTERTDYFVYEVISSNISFPNSQKSSIIDCLSLLIPYNQYVDYAMNISDLYNLATYQSPISNEYNAVTIYGGTLQEECELDGNNIMNVTPNNQMGKYEGNTIRGLSVEMHNAPRLAKLSDFVYIQGLLNNINYSSSIYSQRIIRYYFSFTIYAQDYHKNVEIYLSEDYIRKNCNPNDMNSNNHAVYYSTYNVIKHKVKCSYCSFEKIENHNWIHKMNNTYCSKCDYVSSVQPWSNDFITN